MGENLHDSSHSLTLSESKKSSAGKAIVVKRVVQLGEELAETHPEIADLYRGGLTGKQIAKTVFDRNSDTQRVRITAVGVAVRLLIPAEERAAMRPQRNAERQRRTRANYGDTLTPLRWKNPWSTKESEKVTELLGDPQFHRRHGSRIVPNFALIADVLNQTFHDGDQIRSAKTVRNYQTDIKRGRRS